jgi:hypothetical protein
MKYASNIPANKNTLFLRNLETILISEKVICSCSLSQFRRDVAPFVLGLLDLYNHEIETLTCDGLVSQYVADSLALRKHVEHLSMNTNEMHL